MSEEAIFKGGSTLCSPVVFNSTLYFISQGTGEVFEIDLASGSMESKLWGTTGGHPSGAAFDARGTLYVADFAHAALLAMNGEGEEVAIAKEYEGRSFKGPHSIVFDKDGVIFFTDSGPLGETSLDSPKGSLYSISGTAERPLLRPLSLETLAYPCGVAISPVGNCIYVAEMMRNRVLRFVQKPRGVYHSSVFYQFSGGMGPSGLAVSSTGVLYVARYDLAGCSTHGRIAALDIDGNLVGEYTIPYPEVTGIALYEGPHSKSTLFVTESSTNSVFRLAVGTTGK